MQLCGWDEPTVADVMDLAVAIEMSFVPKLTVPRFIPLYIGMTTAPYQLNDARKLDSKYQVSTNFLYKL